MSVTIAPPITTRNSEHDANMCSGCPGLCCTTPIADLTSYDVFRIAAQEGRPIEEFAELRVAKPDDAFSFKFGKQMVKIVLKKKYDACVFYNGLGPLYCSVEKSKPSVCLAYPFFLREGKTYVQERTLCPQKNLAAADLAKMSPQALKDCRWEFDRYAEIVDDWNATADESGTLDGFFKFASDEMELEMSILGSLRRRLMRFFSPRGR
jgi:Fe-S-cluster containining protein